MRGGKRKGGCCLAEGVGEREAQNEGVGRGREGAALLMGWERERHRMRGWEEEGRVLLW